MFPDSLRFDRRPNPSLVTGRVVGTEPGQARWIVSNSEFYELPSLSRWCLAKFAVSRMATGQCS